MNFTIQSVYESGQKAALVNAMNTLQWEKPKLSQLDTYLDKIGEDTAITAVAVNLTYHETKFNDSVRWALSAKKLAVTKLWFVEDRIEMMRQGKQLFMRFDQGKAQNTYLAYLFPYEDKAVILVISMVDGMALIQLINRYLPFAFLGVYGLAMLLMWQVSVRLTKPIAQLKAQSEAIARHEFVKSDLRTGDELESLGVSLNQMSSELENYHLQMTEKNELLKETIQGMSHEMKTPLALINAYAAGIRDGIESEKGAEIIMTQVGHLSHMIDQMLALAKYEQIQFEKRPVDLIHLSQNVMDNFQPVLEAQALYIKSKFTENALIECDEDMLRIVVQNLLSNAIKYTVQPEIYFEICQDSLTNQITLTVQNASSEMLEETMLRLKEPFYVAERSRSRLISGTGLGLSIVATVLKRHNYELKLIYDQGSFIARIFF